LSKKEKLLKRFLSKPNDFTYSELVVLLNMFGYSVVESGKTSGSRITFSNADGYYIRLHKPHPRNELKRYQVEDVIQKLRELKLI